MQQFLLIVVFVVCLSSKAQRAFVSADEDGLETTTFGEFSCLIIVILRRFNWLKKKKKKERVVKSSLNALFAAHKHLLRFITRYHCRIICGFFIA